MAASPFEHVMDTQEWHFFESLGLTIHLPGFLTKFMILELIAAGLIVAIYVPLARRVQSGEPVRGRFWDALASFLTFVRAQVAKPTLGGHYTARFRPFLLNNFLCVL